MNGSIVCTGVVVTPPNVSFASALPRYLTGPAGPKRRGSVMTNVAVLIGRLARPAEPRDLPSGDRLVPYEGTIPSQTGRAESVPVVWFDVRAVAEDYAGDEKVLVVGRVRRRFFRGAGGTQSRTEVVADAVVPARQAKRAQAAADKAPHTLET